MLPTKFRFIWQSGFRGEDFQKSTNQKQEFPVAAMFVNGSGRNVQSSQRTLHRCFLSSFGSFGYAVSEEKIFKNRPIKNKNCLWRPCLLTKQNDMCNIYTEPSINASYQGSVHLAKRFQRRIFFSKQVFMYVSIQVYWVVFFSPKYSYDKYNTTQKQLNPI